MEDDGADSFGLEEPVHGLHQRVILGVADGPDQRGDAHEGEMLDQSKRGILGRFNPSSQHPAEVGSHHGRPPGWLNLPCNPASPWWINPPGKTGFPSLSRCRNAIRSGVMTSSPCFHVEACQSTIRGANTFTTKAI